MTKPEVLMSGKEIRQKFIDFFVKKHNHKQMKSSSLIPDNPTVLLTTAGMLQFVPIFLGYEKPPEPPRATSVQKCARAGGKDSDIENVGRTPRHHTFFEMLGNFSFGDYFKNEIIPWSWDFVTNELGLDKDRLWITIYETDEEAFKIWNKKVGIPAERILKKGKKDNFWGPPGPTGPCGPCTEIHFDLGEEYECSDDCSIATCECDRYVEIWNLVFMELNQDEEGNFTPLEKKNVDTGMGLERITMVKNNLSSTFETDLLWPILEKACQMSGKQYKDNKKTDISLRIITDHARCVSFLIADGLIPGNEGRNYVLRMILRRALRHGKLLGLELPFLYEIVPVVIEHYKDAYPELQQNKDKILKVIKTEEERFKQTIGRGESLLEEIIQKTQAAGNTEICGKDAFKLYDTYGFPLELTVEISEENSLSVDIDEFNKEMQEQKERAKQAHSAVKLTDELVYADIANKVKPTQFVGDKQIELDGCIVKAIIKDNQEVEQINEGDIAEVILDKTPFYAESGGQIGDIGELKSELAHITIENTLKFNDIFIHRVSVNNGSLKLGDSVKAIVNALRRKDITIHHTTAHLLQSALKKVLGDSVAQAGSQVTPDRTRFDFCFDRALKPEEIKKVESYINKWIGENLKRETSLMSIDEAKASGAIALFGEKYAEDVKVVSIGDISKELCGGTHVDSTAEIKVCKIVSESAIAAGTRRIEAICDKYALEYFNNYVDEVNKIAGMLKAPVGEITNRVEKLMDELKQAKKQIKNLETEISLSKTNQLIQDAKDIDGGKLLAVKLEGLTPDALKTAVEKLSDKLGDSVVVLASVFGANQVSVIAKVSKNFNDKGISAGEIVKQVTSMCEGRGGGRPNFAQGGAKNPAKLDEALDSVKDNIL